MGKERTKAGHSDIHTKNKPHFELLEGKPYRLKVLWLDEDIKEEDILGFSTGEYKR